MKKIILTLILLLVSCVKEPVRPIFSINDLVASRSVALSGAKNMTISGDTIVAGSKPGISLTNCSNIHITKSKISNGSGINAVGILLTNCTNITIDSCYFTNVASGVYVVGGSGVSVVNNQMQNMVGPYPRGQFVQFNGVSGAGNMVENNHLENISGSSNPEDAISMYMSNGTPASPIIISVNLIRGGGPSKTGGGIMLGDAGGSYQSAINNTLVNPGQYGVAVSGGTNMTLQYNRIFSAKTAVSNVGLYIYNQYALKCAIILTTDNKINWLNSSGAQNSDWNDGNCGTVSGWATNETADKSIMSTILPTKIITYK